MQAGKIYGEGVKGITMDIACKSYNTGTLCKKLNTKQIQEINLISFNKVYKVKNIRDFLNFLDNIKDYVVKIFKVLPIYNFFSSGKKNFYNEINGIKTIYKIYNNDLSKYTTLKAITYNEIDFIGIQFIVNNSHTIYATISKKCSYDVSNYKFDNKSFDEFVLQTLESLSILQINKYAHTDIKADNIIYCDYDKKFKLIDWELLKKLSWEKKHKYFANARNSSPLASYIYGMPEIIAFKRFYSKNNNISTELSVIINIFKEEFNKIKHMKYNELFNKYKYHFDLFAMALTYIYLLNKNNINSKKYMDLIIKMTSLTSKFEDAKEALNYWRSLLK
jgi:serine/threonine protein kinase